MKSRYIFKYLCLLLILFSSCQKEKKQSEDDDTLQNYEKQAENQINKLTIENINKPIENQKVYFGKDSLNQIDMKRLISKHKFFFYFTNQTCPPCVESTVDCIKTIFPEYEKDNEIIFISPDCMVRLRENRYGKKLLILKHGELGIPLEKIPVPFIFTLDNDLKINNLHIVYKNDFSKTRQFLQKLKNNP